MKKNPVIDAEFFYGATPEIFLRASQLRQNMTATEKLLWTELRARKTGFTFRRQHPINLFIADFYCHKANSTLTDWIGTRFFSFFAPALKGERRKIYLFPLGIQGKNR
jgi:hypothetical protein